MEAIIDDVLMGVVDIEEYWKIDDNVKVEEEEEEEEEEDEREGEGEREREREIVVKVEEEMEEERGGERSSEREPSLPSLSFNFQNVNFLSLLSPSLSLYLFLFDSLSYSLFFSTVTKYPGNGKCNIGLC